LNPREDVDLRLTEATHRRDIVRLSSTRIIRLCGYGFLSVVPALYLAQVGFGEEQIGLLFTRTLAGDAAITLWLTTTADRFGRQRTLLAGAMLMSGAGAACRSSCPEG
jgi:MFS family permease